MQFSICFNHCDPSDSTRRLIRDEITSLSSVLPDNSFITATVDSKKDYYDSRILVRARPWRDTFVASDEKRDPVSSVKKAKHKILKQVRRKKKVWFAA